MLLLSLHFSRERLLIVLIRLLPGQILSFILGFIKNSLCQSLAAQLASVWLDQVRHTCVCHERHRLCVPCLLSGVADAVPRAVAWILLGMKGDFPSHFI